MQGNWQLSTGFRWLGAEAGVNGLYRFGERWYDPSTQRWTQQDPLRQAGDLRGGRTATPTWAATPSTTAIPTGWMCASRHPWEAAARG